MTQIKQHALQSGERILLVSVPDDAKTIYVATFKDSEAIVWQCDDERISFDTLPKGNWQLIGLSDVITEEQAKLAIDHPTIGQTVHNGWHLDGFKSLMKSLGCDGQIRCVKGGYLRKQRKT